MKELKIMDENYLQGAKDAIRVIQDIMDVLLEKQSIDTQFHLILSEMKDKTEKKIGFKLAEELDLETFKTETDPFSIEYWRGVFDTTDFALNQWKNDNIVPSVQLVLKYVTKTLQTKDKTSDPELATIKDLIERFNKPIKILKPDASSERDTEEMILRRALNTLPARPPNEEESD